MFARKDKDKNHTEHTPNLPIKVSSSQDIQEAEPALKNRVYRSLLQLCPLSASHRAHLVRRKLGLKGLRSLLTFGSLPHPRLRPGLASQIRTDLNLSVGELLSVPGFFLNDNKHLSIGGAEGLLIPSLDHKGRIQALQIRKDKPGKSKSRYTWMSSASKGGPTSGAPACFLGNRRAETVWVTEGTFKGAALLLHEWTEATIAVAGVGNVDSVLTQLEGLEHIHNVIVAYDADWKAKPGVLRGLARLVEALQRKNVKVQALGWNPEMGKGIDDAIVEGLSQESMFSLPLDGLIRASRKAYVSSHRLNTDECMPLWEPPTKEKPTLESLRHQTSYEIFHALRKPCGTFTSVAANTGSGKTYSTIRQSPSQTLFVYRNYAALEEAEAELREVHGPGKVRVLYGRIAPPSNNDPKAAIRYDRAGCPRFEEMKKRSERGHSPCQGCPFAPKPKSEWEDSEEHEICSYWQQRLDTVNEPTSYLLAVPQSFAYNPSLLQLLPSEETRSLFREYNQLVIDDCPEFVSFLTRERYLTYKDLQQWMQHPELNPSDPTQTELVDWLSQLHRWFQQEASAPELEAKVRTLSTSIAQLEEPVCEQPFGDEWPLRAVHSLAIWLSRHGDVRLEGEGEQRRLLFLQPASELIQRLKYMTVCHLDATPDEPLLHWFSQLAGMTFEAPEMERVFPRIIQVPDILWDRSQIQSRQNLTQALVERVQSEGGIVLGFKNREGEEEHHLPLDGHWGFSERGLNCYTGVKSIALLGHYALPLSEVQSTAWQMRALAKSMDAPLPDVFLNDSFQEERTYSDPWRPWVRTMHIAKDSLVEHLRRHRHTSGVVQGANRSRDLDAPVYLLSGEPLDGLPWAVPVELHTSKEFVELLGLTVQSDTETRAVNPALQTINDERANQAQERLMNLMPSVREYANQLGQVPGIRKLRSFMGTDGKLASQDLAEKAQALLRQEAVQDEIEESLVKKGNEDSLSLIEMGVPDTLYINQKDFKPESGTLESEPIQTNLFMEESEEIQDLPSLESCASKDSLFSDDKETLPLSSFDDIPDDEPPSFEVDVEPLTREELRLIPPLARVRLGICDLGQDNGWNREVIRQIAQTYGVDISLLCRFVGIEYTQGVLLE